MARYVNQVPILEQLGISYRELADGKVSWAVTKIAGIFSDAKVGGVVNRLKATGIVVGAAVLLAGIGTFLAFYFKGDPGVKATATALGLAISLYTSVISPIKTVVDLLR